LRSRAFSAFFFSPPMRAPGTIQTKALSSCVKTSSDC
jgi:hypothetical protein